MSTRSGRKWRDCDPCNVRGYADISPYLSRLVNNITLEGGAIDKTAPDFIAYTLATRGGVAYIRSVNEWTKFTSVQPKKRYGILPRYVKLWSDENQTWSGQIDTAKDNDVVIFPANTEFYPIADKISELVTSLNTVEDNISQNLNNLRQLAVAVVRDDKLRHQLEILDKGRQEGISALGVISLPARTNSDGTTLNDIITHTEAEEAISVVSLSPNAQNYLADYLALKQDYRQELNNTIGVSEVAEKTERRITTEMEMIENSTYAIIDLLCDSINKYAKFYNVDIYAHRAHSACAEHVDMATSESDTVAQIEVLEEETRNDAQEL